MTRFRHHSTVELKHGCIAMLATVGYATPRFTRMFPGWVLQSRCGLLGRELHARIGHAHQSEAAKVRALGCALFLTRTAFSASCRQAPTVACVQRGAASRLKILTSTFD